MDAVESSHSVDEAALKLMGSESEGFVQTEAAVKEVDLCQSNRVFSLPSSSTEHGNSYFSRKDAMASVKQPELMLDKILRGKLGKDSVELSISQGADASEPHDRSGENHILRGSNSEVRLQRKARKVSRGSLDSRRQDVAQLKDRMISDDVRDISDKLGSHSKFSLSPEKAQSVKQKNNFNSKRADKKNLKVSMKSKCDSFSIKAGSGIIYSAASAANNFFGGYGLKSDVHDITKLVDDLSLKDLLGGTCKCPSLSKDVLKKEAHENENFLQSVRKACSILQLPRLVQSLNIEADSVSTKKMSTSILSCVSAASGVDGDVGDDCMTELSSCNKDSCSKADIHANPLDVLLYKPHDISELLALPPPKDLDSLLQEATKPSLSSKIAPDIRSGKQLSRRASLLPFQWSHSFSGHSKPISDSAKLSASRSSCPGRWSRVRNFAISPGNGSASLINLESLTYNQSLVPLKLRMVPSSLDKVLMDVSDNNPQYSWKLLSPATSSKPSSLSIESGGKANFEENGQCPVVVGAAQTLFDMATHSSLQNINEIARWPKKTLQKAMKARKLKSNENSGEVLTTSNSGSGSGSGSDYPMKNTGRFSSSKRPRLYTNKNKKDVGRSRYRKGPLNWSTTQSSQLSPSKLSKDLILETRYSTVGIIKQSCMMPPPAPPLEKTWDGQQKVRKLMAMEWRGKERIN